eukprot:9587718-Prorocentrum_lima.AAC.1
MARQGRVKQDPDEVGVEQHLTLPLCLAPVATDRAPKLPSPILCNGGPVGVGAHKMLVGSAAILAAAE